MKNAIKNIAVLIAGSLLFAACKKQIANVQYTGGTAPVLTASSTAAQVLKIENKDNTALVLSWTNPNYEFTTGPSSQDVTYTIQIDTTGSDFVNPNLSETSISKDVSTTLTVSEFNKKLLGMNLQPGVTYNTQIRVRAALGNTSVPLYSNIINLTVTPYLDALVAPPGTAPLYDDGHLYLVGSATAGGWDNPVPVPTQEFTKVDATHYTITVPLTGGQEYLMLPKNGDWSSKYGNACGSNSCNSASGDNFKAGGDNIKGPASSGTYTITVNFVTGKFTIN
jgi:starch-binding outer membrane protein SusE/F